jgi:hypothetical protein
MQHGESPNKYYEGDKIPTAINITISIATHNITMPQLSNLLLLSLPHRQTADVHLERLDLA